MIERSSVVCGVWLSGRIIYVATQKSECSSTISECVQLCENVSETSRRAACVRCRVLTVQLVTNAVEAAESECDRLLNRCDGGRYHTSLDGFERGSTGYREDVWRGECVNSSRHVRGGREQRKQHRVAQAHWTDTPRCSTAHTAADTSHARLLQLSTNIVHRTNASHTHTHTHSSTHSHSHSHLLRLDSHYRRHYCASQFSMATDGGRLHFQHVVTD